MIVPLSLSLSLSPSRSQHPKKERAREREKKIKKKTLHPESKIRSMVSDKVSALGHGRPCRVVCLAGLSPAASPLAPLEPSFLLRDSFPYQGNKAQNTPHTHCIFITKIFGDIAGVLSTLLGKIHYVWKAHP